MSVEINITFLLKGKYIATKQQLNDSVRNSLGGQNSHPRSLVLVSGLDRDTELLRRIQGPMRVAKQFTRQEIEKHSSDDDCWIVVEGKVYDATSVLSWHSGGKAAIVGHAGKVHQETSDVLAKTVYSDQNSCVSLLGICFP